jgi:ribonuclease P protein component
VDRNVVKRRLREIGRRRVLPALDAAGVAADVLVRARRSAYDTDFAGLEREVMAAVEDLWSPKS